MEAGIRTTLKVAREVSPYGFFLTDGNRDVLLHYSQVAGGISPGDEVEVFLYHDSEDRLAATMKRPLIEWGKISLLEVMEVHPRLGCFLDMGLDRHLLLPVRELPEKPELRPVAGDRVYVYPDRDKQGRLLARLAREQEFEKLVVPAPGSWKNRWVDAIVYKSLQLGSFVICDAGVLGFGVLGMIHRQERTRELRVGEQVRVRVAFVRPDGRVNLSMRKPKHESQTEDAERVLAVLRERPNGAMPYSDETPADIIAEKFQMSKAAFKRALGRLMKEGKVRQQGNWTYLQQSERN
jgi:hypothetical protein